MRSGTILLALLVLGGGAVLAVYSSRGDGASPAPSYRAPEGVRIRVDVLNAGGQADMARLATLRLRDLGFDVVSYGNAGRSDEDSTRVYDRVGREEWAEAVAGALGVGVVESRPDTTLFVEVTVLVGKDWSPDRPSGFPGRGGVSGDTLDPVGSAGDAGGAQSGGGV